jgi:hypothetical protein
VCRSNRQVLGHSRHRALPDPELASGQKRQFGLIAAASMSYVTP